MHKLIGQHYPESKKDSLLKISTTIISFFKETPQSELRGLKCDVKMIVLIIGN